METLVLWVLLVAGAGAFVVQAATRVRLIAAAHNTFSLDRLGSRVGRFLTDVVAQRQTIRERPAAGIAHLVVFWGFVAFSGYSVAEFLRGLGVVDMTGAGWFHSYRLVLTPFAIGVLLCILFLLVRRAILKPEGLGDALSIESVVIAVCIATLMVTFLLTWRLDETALAGRVNWWVHTGVILLFLALIPASKHAHLVLAPITVFLKSPELGRVPNLDIEKGEVGLEVVKDLGSKTVLDALTCVECGRCQVNCPAWGAGQELNPKAIILETQDALLAGQREAKLADIYSERALWQCTTCGACERQCPVGIEHLPLLIGARRGLVSNGDAPSYLGAVYTNLERRFNIWGLGYDERQKFLDSARLETFDAARHDVLVWLGCAGAFEADFQRSLRSLFEILQRSQVRFGVLAKERCTGDPAKRTGNEYLFQELARANIETLRTARPKKIVTSCPHCVKTIGDDYRRFGYDVEIVHSAVFVEELTRGARAGGNQGEAVTYHDPCYLGRYSGRVDEPRELLTRFGARLSEPTRNRENPYCCGAGGGLLFADREDKPGTRISDVRLGQLRDTGASTVVTACPFCSVMLKGAQASQPDGGDIQFVDLMTFVSDRLSHETAPAATPRRGQGTPR